MLLLCLLELNSISFRTITLPNRLSVNLFAGLLVISIIGIDCSLYSLDNNICSIPLYIIGFYINLYEQMNTLLQMFIFTLLTTDYDSGIIYING